MALEKESPTLEVISNQEAVILTSNRGLDGANFLVISWILETKPLPNIWKALLEARSEESCKKNMLGKIQPLIALSLLSNDLNSNPLTINQENGDLGMTIIEN